jgi:hypothetical protein
MKKYANAYDIGRVGAKGADAMRKTRLLLGAGLLAAVLQVLLPVFLPMSSSALEGAHGEALITCTNQSSGATWQVKVDYDHATADSYPARISDTQISWKDASDGGNYTLDRKSGELTVIFASSTGGYFLHHRCKGN